MFYAFTSNGLLALVYKDIKRERKLLHRLLTKLFAMLLIILKVNVFQLHFLLMPALTCSVSGGIPT
jgi:hypothetical protein